MPGSDVSRAARGRARRVRRELDALFSRTLRPAFAWTRDSVDRRTERRHGINTFGETLLAEHDAERVYYKPLPWNVFSRVLRKGDIGYDDVFLDLGAGKGRAVFLAASGYPFKRVLGVELSHELSAVARANIAQAQDKLLCDNVDIVTSDVLDYEIPDDVTVVFLYNPFRGQIFASVIQKLLASVDRRPRRMRVIYFFPAEFEHLRSTGRFRLVRRVRGWRPTRQWAHSNETYLLEVLPLRGGIGQQTYDAPHRWRVLRKLAARAYQACRQASTPQPSRWALG
ncbi:MAG TPA: methyltransferase domain-containing protein [Chloroflexota bacterium]|nr:methyltransferase domain-containing protein [Chloroflexota bacterium]